MIDLAPSPQSVSDQRQREASTSGKSAGHAVQLRLRYPRSRVIQRSRQPRSSSHHRKSALCLAMSPVYGLRQAFFQQNLDQNPSDPSLRVRRCQALQDSPDISAGLQISSPMEPRMTCPQLRAEGTIPSRCLSNELFSPYPLRKSKGVPGEVCINLSTELLFVKREGDPY